MVSVSGLIFLLLPLSRFCQESLSDPWSSCPADKMCRNKFANGICDTECSGSQCLRDGFDCIAPKPLCNPGYIQYCRDHYNNMHCEGGCNVAPCGWDGSDCYVTHHPSWAKGTLILQTSVPFQKAVFQNSSLLWALSVLLHTSVTLRGGVPFQSSADLNALDQQQLIELHHQAPSYESNGTLLFLQVDNRPCSQLPFSCFPYASEAADFLNAMLELKLFPIHVRPDVQVLLSTRGINKEIMMIEKVQDVPVGWPTWLWPVVGTAVGIVVSLVLVAVAVLVWIRRRRDGRERGERVHHGSTATETNEESKAWMQHTPERKERSGRATRDKDRNGVKKKKKKGKELGKKRREPLGEDAVRMKPLRKAPDIGSDTDVTQSSMEDISKTIRDHRSPVQKHLTLNHHQLPVPTPPRRWDRNPIPTPQRTPSNVSDKLKTAPVQWCGPDGSVVLIRAVRSGLDRVVLELLRAGVPVNNTDHTGRSALHWACSVNHLSLARTLIRYGAAVDMQDHKGETALFLSALHGCYETTRFLLLNNANQDLTDRRGRRPIDVAREGTDHQVLELLLAHEVHRSPFSVAPTTEVLWDDRDFLYSPWAAMAPSLPGRSASFSGVVAPRDMPTPQPSDWQLASPQNWRHLQNQSATALVSPRILTRPSRPISTLQEVTSEAEDEEREAAHQACRAATPRFLYPQPAPRQRSFSCTQPAPQRRHSTGQAEPRPANGHVEGVVVPHRASQSESTAEHESCEVKGQSEGTADVAASVQTVM